MGLGLACLSCAVLCGLHATVAVAAQQSRKTPPSLLELEAAVTRSPRDPKPLVILGLAYLDTNDSARALDAFQRAVQVGPQSAEAHNWLGVALSSKADLPAAIAEFRKAVALDPEYGRAYSNLGSALAQSGDYAEAVEVFQRALALEPNSVGAHLNLGMALREKGDLEAALEHLKGVAAAEPKHAGIQYELGQTLRQNGDLAAAAAAFEKAIELDPELREGYYALGQTLKQQSASSRRAPTSSPGPADDLVSRAQEAITRGDLERRAGATRARPCASMTRTPALMSCSGSFWASKVICRPPALTWSAQSPSSPTRPKPTTISASRCGMPTRKNGRLPNCARASRWIRPLAPAMRFSEPRFASVGTCPGRG